MPEGFVDVENARRRLITPEKATTDGLVKELQGALDWIGWIDQVLDAVFDFSFTRLIVEELGLNYQQLRPIATSWNNIRWASIDVRANITAGFEEMGPHWDGNAAMAFQEYISRWNSTLADNDQACQTVRDSLVEIADELNTLVEAVIAVLNMVTTILEYPGIAPLKLAWNSGDIVKALTSLKDLIGAVETTIDYVEKMMHAANGDGSLDIPEVNVTVPDDPYDNPLD
jgi:uncharacterized protein YukE